MGENRDGRAGRVMGGDVRDLAGSRSISNIQDVSQQILHTLGHVPNPNITLRTDTTTDHVPTR